MDGLMVRKVSSVVGFATPSRRDRAEIVKSETSPIANESRRNSMIMGD